MRINCNDTIFEIEDKFASYSPYLSALLTTGVGVDVQDGDILIDLDPIHMEQYLSFLKGEHFNMDEEIAALFDFMGHENRMDYPLDYWAIKLRDNWIRDNMYRLSLYENPLYGLTEIPIINKLRKEIGEKKVKQGRRTVSVKVWEDYTPPSGTVIAGGAALYMAGGKMMNDIDHFFTCPKKQAEETLTSLGNLNVCKHTANYQIPLNYRPDDEQTHNFKASYIFRLYKAPTEVVHGFDLDCVGFVYTSDGKLYATERAMYSMENKVNWFDPSRCSPSYASRLLKYMKRGYKIELPLISEKNVDKEKVDQMYTDISHAFVKSKCMGDDDDSIYPEIYIANITRRTLRFTEILDPIFKRANASLDDKHRLIETLFYSCHSPKDSYSNIYGTIYSIVKNSAKYEGVHPPSDPASLLLLAKYCSFYPTVKDISDYDPSILTEKRLPIKKNPTKYNGESFNYDILQQNLNNRMEWIADISRIQWLEQDPMQQVTSTIYPTPISNLRDWYAISPLYKHTQE